MSKKQYGLVLVVAMVAGLVGGVVSSWFLGGTPVFALKAPQPAKILQAERFQVVDRNGNIRAELGMMLDGTVSLLLADRTGKSSIHLFVLPNGDSSLALHDQAEKVRAILALADGEPGLSLFDKDDKIRTTLSLNNGDPALELFDKNRIPRAVLGSTDLDVTRTGSTEKRAVSSLVLSDKDRKVLWAAP